MARYVLHTTTLVIFIVLQVGWFPESYVQLIDQQLPETPPPASLQQLTETTDSEKQLLNRGQSPDVVIAITLVKKGTCHSVRGHDHCAR